MAVTLGKRKRREVTGNDGESSDSSDTDARALFQRAFEAKFKPLKVEPVKAPHAPEVEGVDAGDDSESDWNGLSDSEGAVEVIELGPSDGIKDELARLDMKAFMVS